MNDPGGRIPGALNQQLLGLAELLQLCARAREASRGELPFVIANETIRVISYDQAILWDARSERLVALSGAARIEPGAPYVLFLNRLYKRVVAAGQWDTPHTLDPAIVGKDKDNKDNWLAPHLLWWPLRLEGQTVAILLLGRRDPWTSAEEPLLEALCGSYAQAWELARVRRAPVHPGRLRRLRRVGIALLAAALLGAGLIPVRSSAVAPAEVVARAPAFVRAPFAGVVDSIEVAPNAMVRSGQVLVRLDRRQLEAGLRVAAKAAEVATAQYRQATQEGITDPRAREQLVVLRGKLDEARADYDYRQTLLGRADIPSPADGIAVFNDPADWIGRPVETGERIMQVSPPTSSRIEIELPVTETMTFDDAAEVLFFNNVNPDQPIDGRLVFMSYATTVSPTGVLVYTARADLAEGSALRLGLKGTAKIFGRPRPLVLQLLRRPMAYLRELLA
jgi:HlyD family secretion protein/Biotin-lipoyl like